MPENESRRPTPEELLHRVEAEDRRAARGKLKIFLGYASGVGKSFRMFDEGRRRKERGQDVIVAASQDSASPEVAELLRVFEVLPSIDPSHPSIDLAATLRRNPQVCLIDGLAYRNPTGSKNAQRWQDVEDLLAAGISVISTINLQFVKELQRQVEAIRGKAVSDSVPESFLHQADEIEVVDAPPEYCVVRSPDDGKDPAQVQRQLSELREIALLFTAEVVDRQLEDYLRRQGVQQVYGTHERILVCITSRSNAAQMIDRGRRQADRFHGELHAVYVDQADLNAADRQMLERNLDLARQAKAKVEVLQGEDPIECILSYARRHGITQVFLGHSQRQGWLSGWLPNPVERLIMDGEGIDVRIFPNDAVAPLSPHV